MHLFNNFFLIHTHTALKSKFLVKFHHFLKAIYSKTHSLLLIKLKMFEKFLKILIEFLTRFVHLL